MAVADPDGSSTTDAGHGAPDAFLEHSYLTYIIPFATNFDPKEALQQGTGSLETKIANVEQRDQLFFGMRFAPCSRSSASHCS